MFMMMYFTSFILVLSCKDWFLIWLGLEINMISFIMMIYMKYSMLNIESCMKYFFIQSLGSVMLLMFMYLSMEMFSYLSSLLLCYKIGGGPFYFWFPSICSSISWWSCFYLMTLQKIIPLMLMSLFVNVLLWLMSMISLVIGVMGSMNQIELKQLMAFSSIHHIGWMLLSFVVSDMFWMTYLLIYSIMMLGWIMYLDNGMINNIMDSVKFSSKWIILLVLLNLGGIPPMMGFFLKWWSFNYFLIHEFSMMILLVIFSVIMLYIYFRIMYDFVLGGSYMYSWKLKMQFSNWFQYDVIILLSFCLGSMMCMIMS
uniref:NADH dehydrogenase subunit 2 n=1 Tax=Parasteatoda cingulata TaxID=2905676 RepID=UPI002237AE81|nr:NADH dehydrogenase subunit 2 [Parasteatoda cingulata]UYG23913.1 NADH dehydrogenase subunit 2 [Parasteatoda cingulata]